MSWRSKAEERANLGLSVSLNLSWARSLARQKYIAILERETAYKGRTRMLLSKICQPQWKAGNPAWGTEIGPNRAIP
jgi:hypothetical protein